MPRNVPCPICAVPIDCRAIASVSGFRCPHCGEALRVHIPARSHATWVVLLTAIVTGWVWGVISVPVGWLLLIAAPIVAGGVYGVIIRVLGPTLEPLGEAGRIPLGESADE